MFRDRSVVEVIELLLAFTVCLAVLLLGGGLLILAVVDNDVPQERLADASEFVRTAISTMLAAVLGLLAGRTITPSKRPEEHS